MTNMNRVIFLVFVFLFACSKDPSKSEKFQKLQSRMWKLAPIVYIENNGRREVSIPATMNSQYVKFTSSQIEYYYSFNSEPPIFLSLMLLSTSSRT